MLPRAQRGDFQDVPQWRTAALATVLQAEATQDGPVIVAMSIVRADYLDEIVGGLKAAQVSA